MNQMKTDQQWQPCEMKVFWGEIAPCEHVVQIYEDDDVFMTSLAGFAGHGIEEGECVIVIATNEHLAALNQRLKAHGFNVETLISKQQYMPLNAEEMLTKFMVTGWPDEKLFNQVINDMIEPARKKKQQVRAFGEMVAILWSQGFSGATVQLEHLWNKFCEQKAFCLYCAYPKSGFTDDAATSMMHICSSHSKMIAGSEKPGTSLLYKNTQLQ